MSRESSSFAIGSTGAFPLELNIVENPTWIKFWTGGLYTGDNSTARSGDGYADDNIQWAKATAAGSSGRWYKEYNDSQCIAALSASNGDPVVLAEFVSFGSYEVNLDFSVANANYTIFFECGDD